MKITSTGSAAFINYLGDGSHIKDLKLENIDVRAEKYAAALVLEPGDNILIENVEVSGKVQSSSYAAGLVFETYDGTVIKNCVNYAEIVSGRSAGILCWPNNTVSIENVANYGKVTGSIGAAGIANRFQGTMKNAVNRGDIRAEGIEPAAGVVGIQNGTSTYEYCYNYGGVVSITDNPNSSAAGILGQTPGTKASLNYCANYGNITAEKSYAAGIAYGLSASLIDASYCYNEGNISGGDAAGGIAPKAQYGNGNNKAAYSINSGNITSAGKTYQVSDKNIECYYYSGEELKDANDNKLVESQVALSKLNAGNDNNFFTILSNGKIGVK